jgi:hypothetical protein
VTQLLFEHSLKIRLKAEAAAESEETTKTPSETIGTGKDEPKKADTKNLLGKINNLVTTDLTNLGQGKDVLRLAIIVPLQLALSMWFLYTILGWR